MKLACANSNYVASVAALTALTGQSRKTFKFIGATNEILQYFPQADNTIDGAAYEPDDQNGYWAHRFSNIISIVDDGYDFNGNSATDISSIIAWDRYGLLSGALCSTTRNAIYGLYVAAFNTYSPAEQIILSKWFVADSADRDTVHSADEQEAAANYLGSIARKELLDADFSKFVTRIKNVDNGDADEIFNFSVKRHIEFTLSWSVDGIYGSTSTSFGSIPTQIILPKVAEIFPLGTKLEAKLHVSTQQQGGSTGEADIYDYTSGAAVSGSTLALHNGATWDQSSHSDWLDVTAYEGRAVRPRIRRVTGTGQDSTQIEGASLKLRIS